MEFINTSDSSELKFRLKFEEKLHDYEIHHQGSFRKPWTKERILEVTTYVINARVSMIKTENRTSMSYYWLSKYDLMVEDDEEYLIFKRKSPNDPVIRIIPREEYFNLLTTVHKACGHGGRDKMVSSVKTRYYITKKAIEIFLSLCPTCNAKRNTARKGIAIPPIALKDFNSLGQVSLIDFQSCPDGEYKWLLIYLDNATKFFNLRPLKSKMASEVAMELMKIFLIFGPPCILESDNGREFTAKVIKELIAMWPDCKIDDSPKCPKRPQMQVNAERSYPDVERMIRAWMTETNTTNWSVGCYFCQYKINTSFHQIIEKSPYKALFGSDPLRSTNTPSQLLNIKTEKLSNETSEDAEAVTHESLNMGCGLNSKVIPDGQQCFIQTESIRSNFAQNAETHIIKEESPELEDSLNNENNEITIIDTNIKYEPDQIDNAPFEFINVCFN